MGVTTRRKAISHAGCATSTTTAVAATGGATLNSRVRRHDAQRERSFPQFYYRYFASATAPSAGCPARSTLIAKLQASPTGFLGAKGVVSFKIVEVW